MHGEYTHGELAAALRALSQQRFRPLDAASTRTYSVPTLERWPIGPMTADDTAAYGRMRLGRVGCDRELFADEALATLHQAAGSSLREIDRLATAALREAAQEEAGGARGAGTRGRPGATDR